jgi:hypothetical protein
MESESQLMLEKLNELQKRIEMLEKKSKRTEEFKQQASKRMSEYWSNKKSEDKRIRDENEMLKQMLAESKKTQIPKHMQKTMVDDGVMRW